MDEMAGWLTSRIPEDWFSARPEISADQDEIIIVGTLPAGPGRPEERIASFRESSRDRRMRIALEAERRFGRKVSWGAEADGVRHHFSTLSLPVMTRLRQPERQVLDTLIAAGVARSRSEALGWCVRLIAEKQAEWLSELRGALQAVEKARAKGPRI